MIKDEHDAMIRSLRKFIDQCHKLQAAGHSEKGIAEAMGFTQVSRFRQYKAMALRVLRKEDAV